MLDDGGGRNIISVHAVCTGRVGAKWSVGGAEYVHGVADGGWIQQVKKEKAFFCLSIVASNIKRVHLWYKALKCVCVLMNGRLMWKKGPWWFMHTSDKVLLSVSLSFSSWLQSFSC